MLLLQWEIWLGWRMRGIYPSTMSRGCPWMPLRLCPSYRWGAGSFMNMVPSPSKGSLTREGSCSSKCPFLGREPRSIYYVPYSTSLPSSPWRNMWRAWHFWFLLLRRLPFEGEGTGCAKPLQRVLPPSGENPKVMSSCECHHMTSWCSITQFPHFVTKSGAKICQRWKGQGAWWNSLTVCPPRCQGSLL